MACKDLQLRRCEENPADYLKINGENYPEILKIIELVKNDIPRLLTIYSKRQS